MGCEHYMSERYHSGRPRQEGTSGIFVLGCEFCSEEDLRRESPSANKPESALASKNELEETQVVAFQRDVLFRSAPTEAGNFTWRIGRLQRADPTSLLRN